MNRFSKKEMTVEEIFASDDELKELTSYLLPNQIWDKNWKKEVKVLPWILQLCDNDMNLASIVSKVGFYIGKGTELRGPGLARLVKYSCEGGIQKPVDDLRKIWQIVADRLEEEHKLKQQYRDDKKKGRYACAQYLIKLHHLKTIDNKNREIFRFANGFYKPAENFLYEQIQEILKEEATRAVKNEIVELVKGQTLFSEKGLPPLYLINAKNGIYNIKTKKLSKHNPKYFFTSTLAVKYDKDSDCSEIKTFLSQLLPEKDIEIIQRWFGYCLYRDYGLKKAMIFVGERDTGKTTTLRLLEALVGRENISGVSLQQITSDKFAIAHMQSKMVNMYDDLSFKDINDNGTFKMVTGNGMITGEFKFGHQFHFANYAKLTFSCNKIPSVQDTDDDAYFARWIVVEFNRQIVNPDPAVFEKINSTKELSGLLNFALEGLDYVLKHKSFGYHKTEDEIKTQMLRSGSPLANFVYDCLEESDGGIITKDQLREQYVIYAKNNNLPILTKENIGRKLQKFAPHIESGKEGPRGGQYAVWQNIRFKKGVINDNELEDFELDEESEEFG